MKANRILPDSRAGFPVIVSVMAFVPAAGWQFRRMYVTTTKHPYHHGTESHHFLRAGKECPCNGPPMK
ncbi:MAG TPA: hypothetical protein VN019_10250, partial [Oxalicibacterium sp.]|nr:hypothetical protein [Oxalicibacterium sp.]